MGTVKVEPGGVTAPRVQAPRAYSLTALFFELCAYMSAAVAGYALWNSIFPSVGFWGAPIGQLIAGLVLLKLAGIRPGFALGEGAFPRAARLTAIAGLPLVGAVLGRRTYEALWALRHSPEAVQSAYAWVQQLGAARLLSFGFYSLVLIAVAEELAFRGYFHHRLRCALPGRLSLGRLQLTRGALASGAAFAAVHLTNWLWQPAPPFWVCLLTHAGQFAFGVVAAYLYDETGSLLPPILLHGMINVINHFGMAALVLWLGR